jgi:hypothetical protein
MRQAAAWFDVLAFIAHFLCFAGANFMEIVLSLCGCIRDLALFSVVSLSKSLFLL